MEWATNQRRRLASLVCRWVRSTKNKVPPNTFTSDQILEQIIWASNSTVQLTVCNPSALIYASDPLCCVPLMSLPSACLLWQCFIRLPSAPNNPMSHQTFTLDLCLVVRCSRRAVTMQYSCSLHEPGLSLEHKHRYYLLSLFASSHPRLGGY